jgi:hypothetical protein
MDNENTIMVRKRIGSTVFEVSGYFDPNAKETITEKILNLMVNDLTYQSERGIIESPQTNRLSDGGNS